MTNLAIKSFLIFFSYFLLFLTVISVCDIKRKISLTDIISIVVVSVVNALSNIYNDSLFKGIATLLGFVLFAFKRSKMHKTSFIVGFIVYIYAIIVDTISAFVLSFSGYSNFITKGDNISINKLTYFIILCVLMLLVIHIEKVNKLFKKCIKILSKQKFTLFIIVIVCVIFETSIVISLANMKSFKENILAFILLFTVGIGICILLYNVIKKNELKLINQNLMINNESFMKIINNYKTFKHNFKYELNAISIVGNKKVKEMVKAYIDEYEENISFDDSDILKLPDSIRSLVYRKILETGNINCNIIVDNFLVNDPFNNMSIKRICTFNQCVGIILDNAIEEIGKSNNKFIYINLSEIDGNVIFECQNQINNLVEVDKIGIEGNSSKHNHMGIGTSYLNRQKQFKISTNIRNDMYIVTLRLTI